MLRPLNLPGIPDGSKGGGSFLVIRFVADDERSLGAETCSYGEVDTLEKDDSLDLGTLTQSGSPVGVKGLGALLGLSIAAWPSGAVGCLMSTLACCLFSNHHFWRSELAGGSPGSIAS